MRRVCVFCGSSAGKSPVYAEAARELGGLLARRGLGLVYGGGHVGLMGVAADAVLAGGGEVIGVIPRSLRDKELAHGGLTDLHVVETMHGRKALMAEKSDAFVALPGGFGTADELFEIVTWAQLRIHGKPVALLNVAGYFDAMLAWVEHMIREGFVKEKHRGLLLAAETPGRVLDLLAAHPAEGVPGEWDKV